MAKARGRPTEVDATDEVPGSPQGDKSNIIVFKNVRRGNSFLALASSCGVLIEIVVDIIARVHSFD